MLQGRYVTAVYVYYQEVSKLGLRQAQISLPRRQ